MGTTWQDIRYGVRMLIKNPGFTIVAVLTLALGIGANTAIFSVVHAVLLRPLPYTDPGRLAVIWNDYGTEGQSLPAVSPPDYLDYTQIAQQNAKFVAASGNRWAVRFTPAASEEPPREEDVAFVTADFFSTLGVQPALGRSFRPEDTVVKGPPVVILTDTVWRREFSADPGIIGRSMEMNGAPFTIVGVLPPGFHLLLPPEALQLIDSGLWLPMQIDYASFPRNLTFLTILARLNQGKTFAQFQGEMDGVAERLRRENAVHQSSGLRIRVVPLQHDVVKKVSSSLWVLLGAVGFVLLIACANLANLLLARATAREREIAVRAVLGATRMRLARQVLTESLLLALLGGAGGILLASQGLSLLLALHPANLPRLGEIGMNGTVLAFTLLACLLTSILFGIAPALQAARTELNETLKETGRMTGSLERRSFSRLLVISEIALSIMLLIGAGLLVRSFSRLLDVWPGFDAQNVTTATTAINFKHYPEFEDQARFYKTLEEKIAAHPGVESVGAISQLPLTGSGAQMPFAYDQATAAKWESLSADWRSITPGYFKTMGIRLLAGRNFTGLDDTKHPFVVIVDEMLAKRAWPGQDAVGKKLEIEVFRSAQSRTSERVWTEVVGVAEHTRSHDLTRDVREQIYMSEGQQPFGIMMLVIRSRASPAELEKGLIADVHSLDKDAPISSTRPMTAYVTNARAGMEFSLVLLGVFAAVALVLASIGLYGVIAYSVAQRTHEIGIRVALGALRRDIFGLVIRQGAVLAIAGIGLGFAGALLLQSVLATLVYGVRATDAATYATVGGLLAVISLVACYLPARRAMSVDPLVALRHE
jgi:putative ABC transport system permease protein